VDRDQGTPLCGCIGADSAELARASRLPDETPNVGVTIGVATATQIRTIRMRSVPRIPRDTVLLAMGSAPATHRLASFLSIALHPFATVCTALFWI
jgi:hypothetical protein